MDMLSVKHVDALMALCTRMSWQNLPNLIAGLMADPKHLGQQCAIAAGVLAAVPIDKLGRQLSMHA